MTDIHSEIADHYDSINSALHERDRLTSLARDLQNKLTVAEDKIEWLGKQLAVTNATTICDIHLH